jgi:hypothetical protein
MEEVACFSCSRDNRVNLTALETLADTCSQVN